jgi:hypothetical protein
MNSKSNEKPAIPESVKLPDEPVYIMTLPPVVIIQEPTISILLSVIKIIFLTSFSGLKPTGIIPVPVKYVSDVTVSVVNGK